MPMEKTFVSQLALNQEVISCFLVSRKEVKSKKNGGDYLFLDLSDKTGHISAFLWENVEEHLEAFHAGDYVKVKGLVKEYNNRMQLTLHKIKKVDDSEVDPADFLPVSGKDVDAQYQELLEQISQMTHPHLRELLQTIMTDSRVMERFKRAPAAKRMHHAYIGGLLDHTLSLIRLCRLVAGNYPNLQVDMLIAGAALHDIGKIEELTYAKSFDYTTEGRLLGHIVMEVVYVNQVVNQIAGFPEDLRLQLLHLLVAHHGKVEFGSPKVPMTLEALVLHYLDDLDSKIEVMASLSADETIGDSDWTGYNQMLERYVYRRRIQ
jgi:3'-5' exoribonuclease